MNFLGVLIVVSLMFVALISGLKYVWENIAGTLHRIVYNAAFTAIIDASKITQNGESTENTSQ